MRRGRRSTPPLDGDAPGAELAETLREAAKAAEKVAGEGGRIAGELRDELVREHKIKPLLDALADTAVGLTSRYKVVSGQFPLGEYQLPAEVPEPIEVPFRELVTQYIETDVAPKLLASARDIADRVSPMGVAFGELERLLAFNVELATAELEVLPDEPPPQATQELLKEMITGQLERSANVVGGYVDSSRHWPRDLGRGMRDSVLGALEDLRGELVDGEISQASVRAKRRAAQRGRIQRFAQNLPRLAAQAREQGVRAVYAIVGERRIKAAWRKLGFPESTREEPLTAADFAAPEATVDLPLVYERLFAADTMEAVEVMAGREGDLDRAVKALSRVEPGRLRAVALVGADGVGKASLSSAITRARRWKSTKRMTFDGPVTVRDVDLAFKEVADTQLVLVDGLFWLLSAQPGGFAPLRRFVDNVIADGGQRGFVVHADDVFWRYAGGIAPLDDAFPTRIALAPLRRGTTSAPR